MHGPGFYFAPDACFTDEAAAFMVARFFPTLTQSSGVLVIQGRILLGQVCVSSGFFVTLTLRL
jgi:hypothetical protein